MTRARDLANSADKDIAGTLTLDGLSVEGNIAVTGTVDSRDINTDGTKLDTIETNADVTDTTNVTAAGALMTTGGTMTGDVTFGDNDKAIFGAGSDLQIYSDGSNSYIKDTADGVLRIQGSSNIQIEGANGENMAVFTEDGPVALFYNNAQKLATTSTGVDITGGVSIDDDNNLSFGDGTAYIQGSGANDRLKFITNNSEAMRIDSSGRVGIGTSSPNGLLQIEGITDHLKLTYPSIASYILDVKSNGDFAIDKDGTERMRIDASGNVGIGTSSPSNVLHVHQSDATSNSYVHITQADGGSAATDGLSIGIEDGGVNAVIRNRENGYLRMYTNNSERMRISSSGFVGINETSPATELDVNGTTTSNQYLLDNIAKDISDTAVDVFVYDTSKDSDGGAWRKRTQGTSWYNETLNTATRGSRKEFPAVAVIVAESNQVTIYDGDDPAMPMWMVFETNSSDMLASGILSLTMLNGVLAVGRNTPLHVINFVSDGHTSYSPTSRNSYLGAIGQRNSGLGFSANLGTPYVVANVGNDVAMTVLPNAPIDAATGLPVPNIAVATAGGVSVIKDDGTVVDITRASSPEVPSVDFYNGYLVIGSSNVGGVWYYDYIPSSDETISPVSGHIEYYDSGFSNKDTPAYLGYLNTKVAGQYIGTTGANNAGLTAVDFNKTDYTKSSTAFITSTYNTGWMNGDIKLATLSDTDDTDVTGSELVTNGTFATSSDWTIDGGSTGWSITGGVLQGSSATGNVLQDITTVVGKKYVISFEISGYSGSGDVYVRPGIDAGTGDYVEGDGSYSGSFTATSTTTTMVIRGRPSQPFTGNIDNVSVRLAEEDRSVNGNGLQVFGSITKNPVATGADLVAYSNFASNRYLRQPYNSDLDYGTGDFHYIWWATASSSASDRMSWGRGDYSATGSIANIYANSGSGTGKFFIKITGETNGGIYSDSPLQDGIWHCFAFVARGGRLYLYIDGVQQATTLTYTQTTTLADAPLTLGNNTLNGTDWAYPHAGNLALFRTGATAPSPEQIAKIYEDEKHLFTENAQATLYGSSDAVTALAYDDTTELLHVGTSAGRSVFQGLRRVDNTTDAVGAAISASNGLVAED